MVQVADHVQRLEFLLALDGVEVADDLQGAPGLARHGGRPDFAVSAPAEQLLQLVPGTNSMPARIRSSRTVGLVTTVGVADDDARAGPIPDRYTADEDAGLAAGAAVARRR